MENQCSKIDLAKSLISRGLTFSEAYELANLLEIEEKCGDLSAREKNKKEGLAQKLKN